MQKPGAFGTGLLYNIFMKKEEETKDEQDSKVAKPKPALINLSIILFLVFAIALVVLIFPKQCAEGGRVTKTCSCIGIEYETKENIIGGPDTSCIGIVLGDRSNFKGPMVPIGNN